MKYWEPLELGGSCAGFGWFAAGHTNRGEDTAVWMACASHSSAAARCNSSVPATYAPGWRRPPGHGG